MLYKPLYYVHMCQKHVYLYDQQSKKKKINEKITPVNL